MPGARAETAGEPRTSRGLALATLCLAVLVAQLDTAVVNLAVLPIAEDLSASPGEMQWVVDSYNVVYAAMLLTGGLLADLRGRRLVFMSGAAIFTVASMACAFAPSVGLLIAARAVAGLGAALLIPASLAIVRVLWPDPAERNRALGIWAGCNGLALAIGPTLGGLLMHRYGWPSVFLVVVPFGLAALFLSALAIPESSDPRGRRFDASAQAFAALALGALAVAAIESREAPALGLGAFVAAILSLWRFVAIERRGGDSALVPLDMFSSPPFRGAVVATTGMTFGMYGVLFLLPQTWQAAGRLDAVGAGVALVPMAGVFVLVSSLSGPLSRRLGARIMTAGGVAVIGLGLLLIAVSSDAETIVPTGLGLALTGLGMGCATGPLMGQAVGSVDAARAGTASALINAARMVGATLGVAVLGAIHAGFGGGSRGLFWAMLAGGGVQIACAGLAWATARADAAPARS